MDKLDIFEKDNSSSDCMIIYHGSDKLQGLLKYGFGKKENDYGIGFYCTEDMHSAELCAVNKNTDGYCNKYKFNTEGLNGLVLDDTNVLQWLALLMQNRIVRFDDFIHNSRANRFINKYSNIDIEMYDYIIGYRADDSYFSIVERFISGDACLEDLYDLLHLGSLGKQIVLKTEKAFKNLSFLGVSNCKSEILYSDYINNDRRARNRAKGILRRSEYKKRRTLILDLLNKE